MATKDTPRRQSSGNIKSAVVTAAIVGTLGGWVAFGSQQASRAADTAGVPVAQVDVGAAQSSTTAQNSPADQGGSTAPNSTIDQGGSTAQGGTTTQSLPSTAPSFPSRQPRTRTRSSR